MSHRYADTGFFATEGPETVSHIYSSSYVMITMCGPVEAQVVTDWCRVCEMEPYGPMPTTTSSSTGAPRAWGAHACTRAPCIVQSALIVQRPCANCGCAAQANEQGMILAGKKRPWLLSSVHILCSYYYAIQCSDCPLANA